MKILRILFGEPKVINNGTVSRELDEQERELAKQERRLERLKHLRRERDLYDRRRSRPT